MNNDMNKEENNITKNDRFLWHFSYKNRRDI